MAALLLLLLGQTTNGHRAEQVSKQLENRISPPCHLEMQYKQPVKKTMALYPIGQKTPGVHQIADLHAYKLYTGAYAHMHTHVLTRIHTYAYTRAHTRTQACTYMHTRSHACMYARTRVLSIPLHTSKLIIRPDLGLEKSQIFSPCSQIMGYLCLKTTNKN